MDPLSLTGIFTIAAAAVTGVTALVAAATSWFTTDQKKETLITAFGRHVRTETEAGFHFKKPWPFNSVEANVYTGLDQVTDTLDTKTKDDLFVQLPITIQYAISDSPKYYFDTDGPVEQMAKIVSAAVRKYTSGKDFQELYSERDEISDAVIDEVSKHVSDYGITIERIVIDEPKAPADVQESYNRVRASEREMDAATNEAQADYIRSVKGAEADKQRNILIGEGVAGFRKSIAEGYADIRNELVEKGVNADVADRFMEEAMRLDTIRDVGDKGNMVIVVPSGDSSGTAREITSLAQLTPVIEKLQQQVAAQQKGGNDNQPPSQGMSAPAPS